MSVCICALCKLNILYCGIVAILIVYYVLSRARAKGFSPELSIGSSNRTFSVSSSQVLVDGPGVPALWKNLRSDISIDLSTLVV